jgi:MerR family transcriptional regulator/heat shock protein HspR
MEIMKIKTIQNVQTFDPGRPMFSISVIADILKVHPRTLRIYDDENILIPSRSPKNRRLYSFNDIEKGKFIQYMTRDLGINLVGIKIIMYSLSKQNISPTEHLNYISKAATELNISSEAQIEKRNKLSKRGRKSINST